MRDTIPSKVKEIEDLEKMNDFAKLNKREFVKNVPSSSGVTQLDLLRMYSGSPFSWTALKKFSQKKPRV